MASDRWFDYTESEIMGHHGAWKRMILRKEEFKGDMVRSVEEEVRRLKGYFREKYKLIGDPAQEPLLHSISFLEQSVA